MTIHEREKFVAEIPGSGAALFIALVTALITELATGEGLLHAIGL
ncbi:MAG: hypothetical protein AB8E74_09310 [Prochlorococcus sp.]